jgi:hypothetical protein
VAKCVDGLSRSAALWLAMLSALSAAPASDARFGKPSTVGTTTADTGHIALAMAHNGRAAVAAGTDAGDGGGRVLVSTRAPGGRFGKLRELRLSGWPVQPSVALPGSPPPLAIDTVGRPITLEHYRDGCCLRLRAIFTDASGRLRRRQVVTPARPNWSGALTSDAHGHAAVQTFAENRNRVASALNGSPFGKARAVPESAIDGGFVTPAPDGSLFAEYVRGERALVARRSPSGRWSGIRELFASDRGEAVGGLRFLHARGVGSAAVIDAGSGTPGRTLVAWSTRGADFGRPREAASTGDASFTESAIDAKGRLTVAWSADRDRYGGETSIYATSARFGGAFGPVRTVWRAPAGQGIGYLHLAAGGGRTVASWTANPMVSGAPRQTIRAVELRAGEPAGEPEVVATPADPAFSARVALDSKGGGVLAWVELGPVADGKQAKRLRAALLPR